MLTRLGLKFRNLAGPAIAKGFKGLKGLKAPKVKAPEKPVSKLVKGLRVGAGIGAGGAIGNYLYNLQKRQQSPVAPSVAAQAAPAYSGGYPGYAPYPYTLAKTSSLAFLRDGLLLAKLRKAYNPRTLRGASELRRYMKTKQFTVEPPKRKAQAKALLREWEAFQRKNRNKGLLESGTVYGGLGAGAYGLSKLYDRAFKDPQLPKH